jgi:A/G-specific adenine glycosylase
VRHGFTHFELEIEVYVSPPVYEGSTGEAGEGGKSAHSPPPSLRDTSPVNGGGKGAALLWINQRKLKGAALPTIMRKIIAHALEGEGPLFSAHRRA